MAKWLSAPHPAIVNFRTYIFIFDFIFFYIVNKKNSMKVTHIAHACMLIETLGIRLLTDPWLEGPTFFGSWWQFPPPKLTVSDIGPVDCIYISHSHRDHQHEPTLRLFDKNTPILIPYLSDQEQHRELQAMGFKNIIELNHKEKFHFKNAIDITLFRNDWDSAILVHDGQSTLLNANDCYISHLAPYIRSLYPKIDIAFFPFLDARDFPASYDLPAGHFSGPLLDEPQDYAVKLTTSSYLFNESMIEQHEYWEDTLLSNLVFVKVKPNIPYTKIKFLKVFFNVRCDEAKFLRVTARKAFEKIRVKITA